MLLSLYIIFTLILFLLLVFTRIFSVLDINIKKYNICTITTTFRGISTGKPAGRNVGRYPSSRIAKRLSC